MRYGPGQNPNAGARGTNSNAHMSHLRYLRSQPHLQQPKGISGRTNYKPPAQQRPAGSLNITRPNQELHAEQAALQRHAAGKWSSVTLGTSGIQKALSAIGLGGAAHPIRRLEHPGGQMMVPYFGGASLEAAGMKAAGPGAVSRALPRAAATKAGEASGTAPAGLHGAYQALQKSERAKDVAATGVAAAGIGGAYAGGFAMAGQPLWRKSSWSGPWFPSSDSAGPSGPSKRQTQNQAAIDQRVHDAFKSDVGWLVGSKQLKPANARETLQWAANMASADGGTTYIRNGRNFIRDNYRPPPGGWPKAP